MWKLDVKEICKQDICSLDSLTSSALYLQNEAWTNLSMRFWKLEAAVPLIVLLSFWGTLCNKKMALYCGQWPGLSLIYIYTYKHVYLEIKQMKFSTQWYLLYKASVISGFAKLIMSSLF